MPEPLSLEKEISPPPSRKRSCMPGAVDDATISQSTLSNLCRENTIVIEDQHPSSAAIEAGEIELEDHLEHFSTRFLHSIRSNTTPGLSISDFKDLYERNQHAGGRHFVIHQHDHPVSGVHYDLRLQFSESSTLSFAIPYGLPGNPNSTRPIRMAIETRVHTLWNNIVESASHTTGSLLIWDTGEYEILPWKEVTNQSTDDELSEEDLHNVFQAHTHSQRLRYSFQRKRIRLRLTGKRLPSTYTISMWLRREDDRKSQPKPPKRQRRRLDPSESSHQEETRGIKDNTDSCNQDESESLTLDPNIEDYELSKKFADPDQIALIRAKNAYPGAVNTVGSIHQRHWFLTIDKKLSGFRKGRSKDDRGKWVDGFAPFFVLGRDHERSIVTGRNADEIMNDEGVDKFVGRKMWRAILE